MDKWDKYFINMAIQASKMTKCEKLSVGAIIVKNKRILATGYNGTPSGYEIPCKCNTGTCKAIHAEANAILQCAMYNGSTIGSTMYVTVEPCINCALLIANCGIEKVIYLNDYKNHLGIDLLRDCNIEVTKYKEEIK